MTFVLLINRNAFAATTDSNTTNQSITPLVFSAIGVSISSVALIMSIFSKPENVGLSTETFVIKKETDTDISSNLSTFWGLNYKFAEIFELNPAISIKDNKNTYLLDTGISLVNNKVIDNEITGFSPFFSAGVSTLYNNSLAYGGYLKAGAILKVDKYLFRFDGGYRFIYGTEVSTNTFILGGNVSLKL